MRLFFKDDLCHERYVFSVTSGDMWVLLIWLADVAFIEALDLFKFLTHFLNLLLNLLVAYLKSCAYLGLLSF